MRSKKKKKQEDLMYLGPTIAGVVRHSTVFKNGNFPPRVKQCLEEYPMMKRLFVPLGQLQAAVKELNKGQGALCTIYRQTAEKFI